ncbi:MAG: NUDIX domain-containing protein [Planctomycetota bacterium]|nr:NUDIX domain-containing protein [Planctomycetota bacterium]
MAARKRQSRNKASDGGERAFLAAYDASAFPHPSVAVDVALVTIVEGALRAVLVRREEHPAKGAWALPGGFVGMDESLDAAAARVLATKVGVEGVFVEQLYTFGAVKRDPRTRVIAVAYYALVHPGLLERAPLNGNTVLAELAVPWRGESGGDVGAVRPEGGRLKLAFDHAAMLGLVVLRLRGKLDYAPIGFELLPRHFTLRQLQEVHETILGKRLNKDSFRRRMLASGRIRATGRREADVGHRPAALYRFARRTKR